MPHFLKQAGNKLDKKDAFYRKLVMSLLQAI